MSEERSRAHVAKKILAALAILALALAIVVVGRALFFFPSTQVVAPAMSAPIKARAGAIERLSQAIRIKTISTQDAAQFDPEPFRVLGTHMQESFPRAHSQLTREVISEHSYLFTWEGKDPALAPVLLMGHTDVVPVEDSAREAWSVDPFGGEIKDGFVWGRGALDDKQAVYGQLEAVEALLESGYQPERTVYLAYGHDEEVGGREGAAKIAALLKSRGVMLDAVVDEGLAIVDGIVPGVSGPVGLVGVSEKGFLTVHLEVKSTGGHSSMPPKQSAVGVLARAVARLEDNQVPAEISGPVAQMFAHLGPEMGFGLKVLFANTWLFGPLLLKQLGAKNSTNATIRTTTAATMFSGSPQDNVLPKRAKAAINFRIHPRDSIASVVEHVKAHRGDERVEVIPEGKGFASEPSPVSSTDSRAYRMIATSIRQVWPQVVVGPSLMVGATDSRHFVQLSRDVYRFSAITLTDKDTSRIHGVDERIPVKDYEASVVYFGQLIRNLGAR